MAETEEPEDPIYLIHLFVYVNISLGECITYDNINMSDIWELVMYSIAFLVLLICILHLIIKKSSLNAGRSADPES